MSSLHHLTRRSMQYWLMELQGMIEARGERWNVRRTKIVVTVRSHSWISPRASKICFGFNFVLHTPVWFSLTCWRRATFSLSDSQVAFIGVSGMKKNVKAPTTIVTNPRTRNITCQPSSEALCTCWNPKDIIPPRIWATPRPIYHTVNRGACSLLV